MKGLCTLLMMSGRMDPGYLARAIDKAADEEQVAIDKWKEYAANAETSFEKTECLKKAIQHSDILVVLTTIIQSAHSESEESYNKEQVCS